MIPAFSTETFCEILSIADAYQSTVYHSAPSLICHIKDYNANTYGRSKAGQHFESMTRSIAAVK